MATVLVVDDVAENRDLVTMLLSCRGHEVLEASDGVGALDVVRAQHPDIVVSDVLMPGIDGLELVHRMRSDADPVTASSPVIFYTANYLEPETRPIADACGVSRVVLRGADPRELLDAVDEVLAAGPVDVSVGSAADFARVHSRAVNAKLVEKDRALRHRERQFEAMATASPVGIALLGADGAATYVNPRLAEITGQPAGRLAGDGWLICLDPAVRGEAVDAVRTTSAAAIEHRYRTHLIREDLSDRWLRVHLRPFPDTSSDVAGAVVMVDDISDVVAAEERIAHEARQRQEEAAGHDAERLDSLRRMAGGIAHDFNNLLGSMLGFTQLVNDAITDEKDRGGIAGAAATIMLEDLEQVTLGGRRATKLTEQLLAFGRREINEPVVVELKAFITAFARELTGENVSVTVWLSEDTPSARIDRRGLDRLLHLLLRNAGEAMPAGGVVTIGARRDPVLGAAVIEVTDTGCGMTPEVQRRAFEPFFSTKQDVRTAGLGLSTAHGIVTQAGGEITLASQRGIGTTVRVCLPAVTPAGPGEQSGHPATGTRDRAGDITVLLVDDDEPLRRAAERFITKGGYRVLTAADGSAALALAEAHPGPIHCLVTDVVMPGMDGRQLAHHLLGVRPQLKVVFISGFAEALIAEDGTALEPGGRIIAKPFTGAELREAIGAALLTGPLTAGSSAAVSMETGTTRR
ncbi:hybrid sensor histidine kinase/response regulator [Actinoplanes xinjiangensis]|uniref:hybrid sensor histidine kinase/response regulator n=1 Tax=Actinoplanes xinjiangensis TaxID=512350 RepID=UPI00341F5042